MRNFFLLFLVCTTSLSCNVSQKPIFIAVNTIQVEKTTSQLVTLKANAIFENPNDLGGSLKSDGIQVFVNDIKVADVSSEHFKVPAKKEFTVPLKVQFNTEQLLKLNGSNAISSLLTSILNKKIKVHYKGDLVYQNFGFSYTYPIDETKMVAIKF